MNRLIIILIAIVAALGVVGVGAQEFEDQPDVRGTPVVDAAEPTIEEPVISVDDPQSKLPDGLTELTPFQTWTLIAGGIATGLTGLLLRWIPIPVDPKKAEDARRAVAFFTSGGVALIGAYLAGHLSDIQPTVASIVTVAGIAWFGYDKVPGIKGIARTLEGRTG